MIPDHFLKISKAHKFLNQCILAYILSYGVCLFYKSTESTIYFVASITLLVVMILSFIAIIRLSLKVNSKFVTVLYALLTLVPGIGGIALLLVSNKANKTLRKEGYKIGFFGSIKN